MGAFNSKNMGLGLAIGAATAVLLPVAAKVISGAARPLIKESIKGGLLVKERSKVMLAEAMESLDDIRAEAKSEVSEGKSKSKSSSKSKSKSQTEKSSS